MSPVHESSQARGPPIGEPWFDPQRDSYLSEGGEYLGRILPRVCDFVILLLPLLTLLSRHARGVTIAGGHATIWMVGGPVASLAATTSRDATPMALTTTFPRLPPGAGRTPPPPYVFSVAMRCHLLTVPSLMVGHPYDLYLHVCYAVRAGWVF